MASKLWNVASGEWGTGGDWSPSGAPSNTDAASLSNGGALNIISSDFTAVAETLSISNGSLTVKGELQVDGLSVSGGSLVVDAGSLYTGSQGQGGTVFSQSGNVTVTNAGNLTVQNFITGTVSGMVNLSNGGSYDFQDTQASSESGNIVNFAGNNGGTFQDMANWNGTIRNFNSSNSNSLSFNGAITSFSYSTATTTLTVHTTAATYTENFTNNLTALTAANFTDAGNSYVINYAGSPYQQISSATYNAATGALTVAGNSFTTSTSGYNVNALTISGEYGSTYTLTSGSTVAANPTATSFTVNLSAADQLAVDGLLDATGTNAADGTPFGLSATSNFDTGGTASNNAAITTSNPLSPTITSVVYNNVTGLLTLNGTGFENNGSLGGINLGQITLRGGSGSTFTFNTSDYASVVSSTKATIDLSNTTSTNAQSVTGGTEASVNALFDKAGTSSAENTVYNLAATAEWDSGAGGTIITKAVTVGNGSAAPAITSATYNAGTGALVVSGSNLTTNAGDFAPTALTLKGQGGTSYTLTGGAVSGNSATGFTVALTSADQLAVDGLLNKNGTTAAGNTTYNIAAATTFDTGGTASNGGVIVSNALAPTISTVAYNSSTGVLTLTGTGFENEGSTGGLALGDITLTGKGGASAAVTLAGTASVASMMSATITLTSSEKTSVNAIFDANGTSDGTTYNLAATAGWDAAVGAAITTHGVTVSGYAAAVAPTIANTSMTQTSTNGSSVTPFGAATVGDTNAGGTDTLTITLAGGNGGTLSDGAVGSTLTPAGVNTYTLTGTAAAITSELDQLSFTPTAGAPNTTSTTTFTLSDKSSATATLSNTDATSKVTDNDPAVAPTITNTSAVQTSTNESSVTPFGAATVGDTNAGGTDTLTITLAGGNGGTLSDGAGFMGSTLTPAGVNTYTLTGTAAAITSELDQLSFTPTAGAPNTSSTTTFTLSDKSSATATLSNTDATSKVTENDPAVAPTITNTSAVQTSTNESSVTPFGAATVGDTNAGGTDTLTITLAGGNGGTLSDGAGFMGSTLTPAGVNTYTLTGTAAAITSELDQLSFTPTAGAPNTSSTTTFTLSDKSSASATLSNTDATSKVTDNDPAVAPTITNTSAVQTSTNESSVTPFGAATVGDTNAGGTDTLTITLAGGNGGTLSDGAGFMGSTLTPAGVNTYTLTGTAAAITSELDQLSFTPTAGAPNTSSTTTFTLSDKSSASATLSNTDATSKVTENDPAVAPTITNTSAVQTSTNESSVTPFGAATVGDTNAGGTDTLTITLAGGNGGTLSDGAGFMGSTLTPAGVNTYTLTGTAAAITSELEQLSFKPTAGAPNTSSTTTFTLSDKSSATATLSNTDATSKVTDNDPAVAPTIGSEAASPTGTALAAGKAVAFMLQMNEAVTATGSSLTLSNGASAAYVSGNGTTSPLTYSYTVAATDTNTTDLKATGLTGTIAGGGTTFADATFAPIDSKDVIDTVAPTVAADGAPAFFDGVHATVLTGTAADTGSGIASVEVYNAAAGMADLGAATVQNGAWSLAVALAAGTYAIDAVATDRAGNAATSAVAPYELITGIAGQPYVGEQVSAFGGGTTEAFYNTNGSVYAAASISTLPDGNTQVDYTGGSVFAALPYTGYADDVRPDGTLAAETFFERDGTTLAYGYGADGTTLETETLYANGAVELSKAFTTLANGDTQIAYAGPLFDANPVYAGYTDIVHNGQLVSETLINRDGTETKESYDTTGTRVGETVYNADGSVQVSKAFSTLANGDSVTAYTGGSVFNGLPYASYTDEYKPGAAAPAVETLQNRDGSVSVQALAQNVALTGSAAPDSFVFGASLGQDSVANFTVAGAAHDTLVLPSSDFANLAAAIAGTRQSGADTIITAANNDQITLTNVNAATLTANANAADFRFV